MTQFRHRKLASLRRRTLLSLERLDARRMMALGVDGISPDTGASNSDQITSATALTFQGFADPDSVVTVKEQGVEAPVGTAQVDASGRWQVDGTSQPFSDGQHLLTAETAPSGEQSQLFTVTVDTTPPILNPISNPPRVGEDAGPQTVVGFLPSSPSSYGEQNAVQWKVVGNTFSSLFSLAPQISATGDLQYQTAANANGKATISVKVIDLAGNESNVQTFVIDVWAVNDPPVVTVSGSLNYTENDAPILIAPNATITDIDSANLSRGILYVTIVNADVRDQIMILSDGTGPGQFWVTPDRDVMYGNVLVGALPVGTANTPAGTGTSPLMVKFTANATPQVVQALVRRLAFYSPSEAPTSVPRTIVFQLSDDYISPNYTYKTVDGNDLQVSVALPPDWQPGKTYPTILFAGGTWFETRTTRYDERGRYLTSRGMIVVQADYRVILEESTQPPDVCIEDMKSAMRWIRQNAAQFGIDPNRIAISGTSMGGYLAGTVAMIDGFENPAEDLSVSTKPNAAILMSAVIDNGPDGWGQQWIGDRYPYMSPAYNVSSDDPPTLLMMGTNDRAFPMTLANRFVANMAAAGVPLTTHFYEGYPHIYGNIEQYYGENWYKNLLDIDAFLSNLGWISGAPTAQLRDAYLVANALPGAAQVPQIPLTVVDVNDAPTLANLPASQQWVENGLPLFIAKTARVWDDSTDFNGGTLTVANTNGDSRDRLQLWNVGDGVGQIGISGSTIRYGGVPIGTFTSGIGATPLVVTFNSAAATPMAVQTLLYRVGFQALGDNPLAGVRQITFKLVDRDGLASAVATTSLEVVAVNDPPVITLDPGLVSLNTVDVRPGSLLFPNASLSDADHAQFPGGTLTVSTLSGATAGDFIEATGTYRFVGSDVRVGDVTIGTLNPGGGLSGADLVVTFNSVATPELVRGLLRSLRCGSVQSGGLHVIQAILTDGSGGVSNPVTCRENAALDRAKVLVAGTFTFTERGAAQFIAPTATVQVAGSPTFASGGDLMVTIAGNATSFDRLRLLPEGSGPGQVGVDGLNVTLGGVVVGKLTGPNFDTPGAIGGNTLIVSFEKGSTADVMQAVVRRIAFSAVNASPSTQTRTIVFSFVESRPSEDVVFKEIEGTSLRMRVYQPDRVAGAEPRPAALFFHGGGWTTGVLGQFRQQLSYLASRGLVAIDVEYRLLPQNVLAPPVSAIRDAKSAVRWVRQHATELGVDPNRIAATGASAGGHLAASAGMIDGVEEAGEDQSISSRPNLLILWNAVVDNGPDGYAPELFGAAYPQYSPAYNASADDPPVLAFYAGNDSANPLPIRQRFQNTLQTAGIENTFYTFPGGSHTAFNVGFFNDRYAYDSMRIVDQYLSQRNWLTGAPALALPDAYALELGVIPGTVSAVQVDVKLAGNAAPTLTNLLASQQWVENGVPLFVAKTARVWEDSADFNGGTLTIANVNGDSRDRLQLWNVGDGAGQIGISGNTIRYGGATIGTYTGGVGSMPLVVTFNSAAATPMAVQNLLYRVGFQALGDNPLAGVRQITFKLVDRDGLASAIATTSVEVVAVNDPPALAGIVSSDYPASGGPYPFLPGATVTDPDSPNFDTGGLTVHFQQGVSSQNRIALSGVASVDSSTGKVSLNGVVIGTRTSDGVGLNDWSVAFNANATPGRVQQLVRLLTFSTTGGAVHPQLQLTLNDGDGGSSSATLSLYLPTALTGILPDRGRSANDRVTNTGVVTFSGIGYPGDNITLTGPGGAVLFRSTVNSVGAWQMDSRTKPFADGTYALTLQSSNGAGSTAPAVNFSITIDTTNPSFSLPSTSITYLEDAGPRTVSGFATNLSAGPAEAGPIFFGVLSYSNPSLFVVQPTIDSNGTLTYQSRPNANGSATLSIKAVDLAGNASPPQSFTIQVTPVNDAPVLNGRATPSLGTMLEDTPNPVEATVSSLLVGNVVEVDGDPVGIAVVAIGNPGKGTYQYQLAGGTWTDMGPVSETSALLLPGDAKVRIVPKADANGIVNFLFRAWDGTSGTPGNKMSLSGSYGGTGSVSSAFAKAVCTITAVNDAPVLTASSSATLGYTRGTSGVLLLGGLATVQDVDSPRLTGGQLKIAGLTGNDVISVTGRYSISDNSLFFTADSQPSVSLGSVDTAADGGSSFTITFNANATLDLIQRLVRTLKFSTTGTSGPRTLQITLSDDQQAVSNMVTRMVNVS